MEKDIKILAIESSCDETAAAVVVNGRQLRSNVISSQIDASMINPFGENSKFYPPRFRFIFLQHGVTKDDVSHYLNKYDKNIYGLVTTGKREHDSFLNGKYYYSERKE